MRSGVTSDSNFTAEKSNTSSIMSGFAPVRFVGQWSHAGVAFQIKDDLLEQVIEAIEKAANTGKIGDGKIFVFDLKQAIRIRTGETGADAL
jgi:nitrogen regulatory protein PII